MKLNERSVAYYATCNSPPDKTGFLCKKGERNTAYHRRWFILKGNMLFYFEDRESREPIGVIVLEGCTVELCESAEEFAFAVKFDCAKARAYKMAADSQVAMESWVKALSRASFDYMRLVVRELEKQLEEIQGASGGPGISSGPKAARRYLGIGERGPERAGMSRNRSGASSSSSSSSSSSLHNGPVLSGSGFFPSTGCRGPQDEGPLLSGTSKENGVAWSKPSSLVNGCGDGASSSYASWECPVTGNGGEGEVSGVRPPPVPPRRRGASLESPVSPGTGCFSKLHDWYGREVEELRADWLQSQ
ncbi:sesquipedalian-1-like [Aplochiton taeniatus]